METIPNEEYVEDEQEYECYNCGHKMIITYGQEVKIKCKKCKEEINVL